jgi:hypothetical protein
MVFDTLKLRESVMRTEPPGALVGSCVIIRQV